MNKALWTAQLLRGVLFSVTGLGKILCYKPEVWKRTLPQAAWFSAVPEVPVRLHRNLRVSWRHRPGALVFVCLAPVWFGAPPLH